MRPLVVTISMPDGIQVIGGKFYTHEQWELRKIPQSCARGAILLLFFIAMVLMRFVDEETGCATLLFGLTFIFISCGIAEIIIESRIEKPTNDAR